jgi:Zn-dependent oligopeptidase
MNSIFPQWYSLLIKNIQDVLLIKEKVFVLQEEVRSLCVSCSDATCTRETIEVFIERLLVRRTELEQEIMVYKNALDFYLLVGSDLEIKTVIEEASNDLKKQYIESICYSVEIYKAYKMLQDFFLAHEDIVATYILDDAISETKKYLVDSIKNYEKNGFLLSSEKRSQLKDIDLKVDSLSRTFSLNILSNNVHFSASDDDLTGLSMEQRSRFGKDEDGEYSIGVDYPTQSLILNYAENRLLRRVMYDKAQEVGLPENFKIIDELRKLADQKATILGYDSYPALDTSDQMAKTPRAVLSLLDKVHSITQDRAGAEKKRLVDFAKKELFNDESFVVEPWDSQFISTKYRKRYHKSDNEKIAEYFPAKKTIREICTIYEEFFSLSIVLDYHNTKVTASDTFLALVYDKETEVLLGEIIFDLYPRENKYSHACCSAQVMPTKSFTKGKAMALPEVSIYAIVANFSKPTEEHDALLKVNEVETFFHELGHALHGIFGKTYYLPYTGYHVPIDFVEVPSQLLERWMLDFTLVQRISSHYKTGVPISFALFEAIQKDKALSVALFYERQLFMSRLFFDMYRFPSLCLDELVKKVSNEYTFIFDREVTSDFLCSVVHIPPTEYGPKYYSYLWSLLYAIEIFSFIKKKGLLNTQTGLRLRKEVLEKGGSVDADILIANFLGYLPSDARGFAKYIASGVFDF